MNRVKEVERINRREVETQLASNTRGDAGSWDVSKSWHATYSDSAYVYVGGLPYELSEGDVATVMAQWGDIVDVNMPRDKGTGKPKGFAFICYEDQRSTVLAVDNFNGAKLLGRTVRCDHCRDFREEQAKDPDAIPDHVARKLSEKELEQRKREIVERNAELKAHAAEKEQRFAEARGTATTAGEREEAAVRASLLGDKERAANAKRRSHIEEVLSRRKAGAQAELALEARAHARARTHAHARTRTHARTHAHARTRATALHLPLRRGRRRSGRSASGSATRTRLRDAGTATQTNARAASTLRRRRRRHRAGGAARTRWRAAAAAARQPSTG
ncbi:hypothetical protein EMIHUDRAFT_415182 [Emiliania huxleyi CCMP1516]|uniref:RRM domain-containing protein n=2 Tax=Emiliania huxleyi TaxID=2903 RepID=A0A0D3KBL0_EMIH1|nr:hypothetical protein EMIHUDRAFT_415182 [Emiliania huxleyi CCMP1516]EOD33145.1 hypothetical protein EMIHUDRAFT_415182 [Emiliania huxleyi CCMP1516]|eukprot:XP_005785574.1 hypothetical protein EMIHUDRAFT_415182 [Emiliania huxleyi CCMP1516]